ncbi:hypothetical protein BJV78DRAFT_372331 [Lactifluus subvellereus]|nr:hypothetical protein BJV78DRAFT_372331 [Lactifluus subvellereus]
MSQNTPNLPPSPTLQQLAGVLSSVTEATKKMLEGTPGLGEETDTKHIPILPLKPHHNRGQSTQEQPCSSHHYSPNLRHSPKRDPCHKGHTHYTVEDSDQPTAPHPLHTEPSKHRHLQAPKAQGENHSYICISHCHPATTQCRGEAGFPNPRTMTQPCKGL